MSNDPLAAVRNFPPFPVLYYDQDTGEVRDWFWANRDLLPRHSMASTQDRAQLRESVVNEIEAWSRALASTRRSWQALERRFREWKAAQFVAAKIAPKEGKPPSEAAIEAGYRTRPEYQTLSVAVERAEESTTALEGIVDALKAAAKLLAEPDTAERWSRR